MIKLKNVYLRNRYAVSFYYQLEEFHKFSIFNSDSPVKSLRNRHSHEGGSPESFENTDSRLRGNDRKGGILTFYEFTYSQLSITFP